MKKLIKSLFNFSREIVIPVIPTHNMKLAFYKAKHGTIVDKLVAAVIDSEYSHVELVFSDGICFSASPRDKGVRFKQIDINNGKWDLYRIEKPFYEDLLIKQVEKFEDQPYDTLGAIGSGIGVPLYAANKKFCSLIIACIFKLENINQNPESLRRILLQRKYISKIWGIIWTQDYDFV